MPTTGNGNPSLGEVARRLDRLEESEGRHYEDLVRRLESLSFVDRETLDTKLMLEAAHRNDLERRVGALESANQWLWRTVGGILLSAVLLGLLAAAGFPK